MFRAQKWWTGIVGFLTPVWNYVDALVHPAARQDALTAARHRAFIAPRLIGSFVALASFPVYLAFRGVPSMLEVGVFGWLVAPILIAYFLSRTGRYESAHTLSSLSLTGLVTVVAWCTGGIGSFAAIWLVDADILHENFEPLTGMFNREGFYEKATTLLASPSTAMSMRTQKKC